MRASKKDIEWAKSYVKTLCPLRRDYSKGKAEGRDTYITFPFGRTQPILVVGVLKSGKESFAFPAQDRDTLVSTLKAAVILCKEKTIRLLGFWPGKWKSDVFELSREYYNPSAGSDWFGG